MSTQHSNFARGQGFEIQVRGKNKMKPSAVARAERGNQYINVKPMAGKKPVQESEAKTVQDMISKFSASASNSRTVQQDGSVPKSVLSVSPDKQFPGRPSPGQCNNKSGQPSRMGAGLSTPGRLQGRDETQGHSGSNGAALQDLKTGQTYSLENIEHAVIGLDVHWRMTLTSSDIGNNDCVVGLCAISYKTTGHWLQPKDNIPCLINEEDVTVETRLNHGCTIEVGDIYLRYNGVRRRKKAAKANKSTAPTKSEEKMRQKREKESPTQQDAQMLDGIKTAAELANLASAYICHEVTVYTDLQLSSTELDCLFKAIQYHAEGNEEDYTEFLRNYEDETNSVDYTTTSGTAHPGHIIYVLGYFLKLSMEPLDHVILWLKLLATFSDITRNLPYFIHYEVTPGVLGTMAAYAGELEVQECTCRIIANIATLIPKGNEKVPLRESAVELLVLAMKNHRRHMEVIRQASLAVSTITRTVNVMVERELENSEKSSLNSGDSLVDAVATLLGLLDFIRECALPFTQKAAANYAYDDVIQREAAVMKKYFPTSGNAQLDGSTMARPEMTYDNVSEIKPTMMLVDDIIDPENPYQVIAEREDQRDERPAENRPTNQTKTLVDDIIDPENLYEEVNERRDQRNGRLGDNRPTVPAQHIDPYSVSTMVENWSKASTGESLSGEEFNAGHVYAQVQKSKAEKGGEINKKTGREVAKAKEGARNTSPSKATVFDESRAAPGVPQGVAADTVFTSNELYGNYGNPFDDDLSRVHSNDEIPELPRRPAFDSAEYEDCAENPYDVPWDSEKNPFETVCEWRRPDGRLYHDITELLCSTSGSYCRIDDFLQAPDETDPQDALEPVTNQEATPKKEGMKLFRKGSLLTVQGQKARVTNLKAAAAQLIKKGKYKLKKAENSQSTDNSNNPDVDETAAKSPLKQSNVKQIKHAAAGFIRKVRKISSPGEMQNLTGKAESPPPNELHKAHRDVIDEIQTRKLAVAGAVIPEVPDDEAYPRDEGRKYSIASDSCSSDDIPDVYEEGVAEEAQGVQDNTPPDKKHKGKAAILKELMRGKKMRVKSDEN